MIAEERHKILEEVMKDFSLSNPQEGTSKLTPPKSEAQNEPDHPPVKIEGIKDLRILQSMLHKRFTGKSDELNTFLDQIQNAYNLCHPAIHITSHNL